MDKMVNESNKLVFFVNGKLCEIADPPTDLTLLTYLRDTLGLKGTKLACGEGGCGACTVTLSRYDRLHSRVIHGAVNACLALVCSLHATAVTTVEGLGSTRTSLHPVQERIYKAHGSQCGFCTPGMVMSMSSMLRQKTGSDNKPSLEEVELAIQGNLCRCTGYRPIVEGFRTLCKDEDKAGSSVDLPDCRPYVPEKDDPTFPQELVSGLYSQPLAFKSSSLANKVHWFRPTSIAELFKIRDNYKRVEYFAGGTGKYKLDHREDNPPDAVIQIGHLEELQQVRKEEKSVFIGSGVTMTRMQEICGEIVKEFPSERTWVFQTLSKALKTLASTQVRNVATVGGHIMWAHPCSDLIPILMAAGCKIEVIKRSGDVINVPLDGRFFTSAFRTDLDRDDLIVGVSIPFTTPGQVVRYYRRARRKDFDLPIANAAFFANISAEGTVLEVEIVAGGMEASFPGSRSSQARSLTNTIAYVKGKSAGTVDRSALAEKVVDDVFVDERAPGKLSSYRRCLVVVFVERFLGDLLGKSNDDSPPPLRSSQQLYEKSSGLDPVRKSVVHETAAEQATGEAVFVEDTRRLEGELVLTFVQSTRSHALVKSLDFSEALKVPGVVGYVTADDIPAGGSRTFGSVVHDEPVLASDKVSYFGQIMAALLSEDAGSGKRAKGLVRVSYEDLQDQLLTAEESKDTDDPARLIGPVLRMEKDQKKPVSPSSKKVTVEGCVKLGGQEHFYMENHCAVVIPDGEKDELTILAPTQGPANLQGEVARVLNVPAHRVTVKCKRIGGAFGGKERSPVALIAAVAARKFRRPIRGVFSREEDMETTGRRHGLEIDYKVTADAESLRITDAQFSLNVNGGSCADLSIPWMMCALMRIDGGYTYDKFLGVAKCLRTNQATGTAMRGFGGPEAQYAADTVMYHLAHAMGKEAEKVQEANMSREGEMLHYGTNKVEGCTLERCWKECARMSGFDKRKRSATEFNNKGGGLRRGVAMAPLKFAPTCSIKHMHQGTAMVMVYAEDGSILLAHGGVEMGQGIHTKMIQVAATELGVPMGKIRMAATSTDAIANATTTGGSTGTDINGPAVIDACRQLMARLAPYRKKDDGGNSTSWEECVKLANLNKVSLCAVGFNGGSPVDFNPMTFEGRAVEYLTYGAACVEVEVDCTTGAVTVVSADIVMDLGHSINPAIDVGQVEGAFVQGLGYVTTEQLILGAEDGRLLTKDPGTYKIPTVSDVPRSFNVMLLKREEGDTKGSGPVYSSKGVGEPPLLAAMVVPLAVRRALQSYRGSEKDKEWLRLDLPMTVDRVRMLATDEITRAVEARGEGKGEKKLGFEI